MASIDFTVKTSVYEGPLDLLVSLIEKREVFINDISLKDVIDDYVDYLNTLSEKNVDNMSEFVLIASTLVLIKSKSLLPTLDLSLEEEESIDELEERVRLYRNIKYLVTKLQEISSVGSSFKRGDIKIKDVSFSPSKDMNVDNLYLQIQYLIANLPKPEPEKPRVVVEKTISLEEVIDNLHSRIQSNIKISFNNFSEKDKTEKINVVVSFLALLELVKQGILIANQEKDFDDISIESDNVETPFYGTI